MATINLVADSSFADLGQAAERLGALRSEIPAPLFENAIKRFSRLFENIGDRVFRRDMRPASSTNEFDVFVGLDLAPCDALFLAALRAGDIDGIIRHLKTPLSAGFPAAGEGESGAPVNTAPGSLASPGAQP